MQGDYEDGKELVFTIVAVRRIRGHREWIIAVNRVVLVRGVVQLKGVVHVRGVVQVTGWRVDT